MNILLSAFNCNPYKGSEDGRGWAWVTELSHMGHEVWVITNTDHQTSIKQALSANPRPNLHFFYHQLSPPSSAWWMFNDRRIGLLPQRFEYEKRLLDWQWEAYQIAKSLTQQVAFDYVHHITNTCVRRPSFMGLLGIPFIVGPLAGGLSTPWALRKSYPLMGSILDTSRDLANSFIHLNPLMHLTFAKASKIYCDSKQTQKLIPVFYRSKSQALFSLAPPKIDVSNHRVQPKSTDSDTFRILFVGRLLFWKGLHLGLQAFALLHQNLPNSHLTIIGKGPDENWLKGLAKQLNIENALDWTPWIDQKQLFSVYSEYDVLLLPSLHDNSPNVILESFHFGLPVICLDLGGPGVMVNDSCGRVIKTDSLSEEAVIQSLSDALMELATKLELRHQLSEMALGRASQIKKFAWREVVEHIYPVGNGLSNK